MDASKDTDPQGIRPDDYPKRVSDYSLEELDGELLLYHPAQSTIVYLNKTASLVWGLCDGTNTVEQIIELISKAFSEEAQTISQDVNSTLQKFLQAGSIEIGKGAPA